MKSNKVAESIEFESSMSNELITVIIPYYKHEKYIEDCILSVINQTYKNVELIVIDDGSPDNGYLKITSMSKRYGFRFIKKENEGVTKTLNLGLSLSNGKFFCALASDDIWLPSKLEKQVKFMAKHDVSAVSAGCMLISTTGDITKNKQKKLLFNYRVYSFKALILDNYYIPALNIMWDSHILKQIGGFPVDTKLEDYASLLRATSLGYKIATLNEVLGMYRVHPENTSSNSDLIFNEKKKLIQCYSNHKYYKYANNKEVLLEILRNKGFLDGFKFLIFNYKDIYILDALYRVFKYFLKSVVKPK